MDKQQKLEYQTRIENYLSKEHVYDLFEDLTKQLIVKQPADPISFLIERLSTPQSSYSPIQPRRYSLLALLDSR
jgi:adenylate kinase